MEDLTFDAANLIQIVGFVIALIGTYYKLTKRVSVLEAALKHNLEIKALEKNLREEISQKNEEAWDNRIKALEKEIAEIKDLLTLKHTSS